jgi:hypothetical protein
MQETWIWTGRGDMTGLGEGGGGWPMDIKRKKKPAGAGFSGINQCCY